MKRDTTLLGSPVHRHSKLSEQESDYRRRHRWDWASIRAATCVAWCRGHRCRANLPRSGSEQISFVKADLSSMHSAQRTARTLPAETTDILVFTTGIIAGSKRELTSEGIKRDMAVSYLSRFVMLQELGPRLGKDRSSPSFKPRVFIVGYPGTGAAGNSNDLNAEKNYKAMPAHMNTVAANEALTLDSVTRFPNLSVYGLNPGQVKSNIRSNFFGEDSIKGKVIETLIGWFTPSAEDYAKKIIPLFVAPEISSRSGSLFNRKGEAILRSPELTGSVIENFAASSAKLAGKAGVNVGD